MRPQPTGQELCIAAEEGDEDAVSALLSRGADPDGVDHKGHSALQKAVEGGETRRRKQEAGYGHEGCVGLLLEGGADPSLKGTTGYYEGKTALDVAWDQGQDQAAAVLEAWIEGRWEEAKVQLVLNPKLWTAVKQGDEAAVSELLSRGADPNGVGSRGTCANGG
eukprot:COSAG03_NODE_12533_length_543_cov_0.567568_1_plen_163_part_01